MKFVSITKSEIKYGYNNIDILSKKFAFLLKLINLKGSVAG